MDWRIKCAAVVPCANESRTIGSVITGVRAYLDTIVVVDDGSSDATSAVASAAGARVLRHSSNQGKGAALQNGWQWSFENGFEWALTLDGDGQHASEDIPAFFRCVEETNCSLVIGNRMDSAAEIPWLRRQVNRWMSRQISRAARRRLPDTQCGFRLMKLAAWHDLDITARHFEIESDLLLAFIARGYRVEFVPIRVRYRGERSKIHPVRDTIRWFRWWKRVRSGSGSE